MMTGLAVATLRHRKGGFVGAFVALFCAAALICGCGMLLETGILGSMTPERYAAAPVIVSGDQNVHQAEAKGHGKVKVKAKPITDRAWIPEAAADRIRALPSVADVATEVTFPAFLPGGPATESWGHGWESAALGGFTLGSGRAPQAAGEIVLDATTARTLHAAPGTKVPVRTAAGTGEVEVVGVTAQGLGHQAAVFYSAAEARKLAGHDGMVSAIGVFPTPTATAAQTAQDVANALAGTQPLALVHIGDDRGSVEFLGGANARIRLISIGAVMAGTSVLVALLVVVGTFALSIQQRQREIAMLRAVAATPKQVRKMIGGEALLVGSVAAALGAVAGIPVGAWLHGRFVALDIVPDNLPLVVTPFPVVAALFATLTSAWAAARISARRATRIRPVEALGEADLKPPRVSWIRALFGVLAAVGGATLTLVLSALSTDATSTPVAFCSVLLWCTALALLGPAVARVTTAVISALFRLSRVGGFLAGANLRTNAHRLASVITPLALLVSMACTILFTQTTESHAASAQAEAGTLANYVLGPKAPADVAADVHTVPGVIAVTRVLHATVRQGIENRRVQAVTPEGLAHTMDLEVTAGSMDRLSDTTTAAATGTGIRLGDHVALALADGTPVNLEVVALYARGMGFGDLTLAHDLVAAHTDVPLDDAVLVAAPGVAREAIAAAIRSEPGVTVTDEASVQESQNHVSASVGYVTLGLIIAFTAIAVLNTLAMSIADRGREFAALRLIGATRRQVMRMLRWETSAVVALATLLGSGIAFATLTAFAAGMTGSAQPSIPAGPYFAVLLGGALLACAATFFPARVALRKTGESDAGV